MTIEQGIPPTTVTLERNARYQFIVRVGETIPEFIIDEDPPLGDGRGPSPEALLGASIGSCLASSLLFCLEKARVTVDKLRVRIDVHKMRNERGRLRIGSIRVGLDAQVPEEHRERFERCRSIFEDYCVVTESVRHGIPVDVDVSTS
jgi:uncharacterized OsmC-like protein